MATIEKAYIIRIPREDSMQYAAECAESCERHGVPYEYFEGAYRWSRNEVTRRTGWVIREESNPDWHNEFMCTVSHLMLWRKIVEEGKTVAVLEHDALVQTDITQGIDVHDGTILNLGYRVDHRSDYAFPKNPRYKQYMIDVFEGTHAYAITPTTAANSLKALEEQHGNVIIMPIDGLMSIHNYIRQQKLILMPTPVICEVRGKSMTMKNEVAARYHPIPPQEYWEHMVNVHKYRQGFIGENIPRIIF